ncbi:MAG TPA: peptide deformylase [Tepidisphaeraceae bacterium]|jgi:peptide deformylase
MSSDLRIIRYPDPRLRKMSQLVIAFDASLKDLAARMLELMKEARGVGLAAPQVGQNIRLFVMNPDGEEGQERIYVNPVLSDAEGEEEGEEGCLSLPNINAKIWRSKHLKMQAQDLEGNLFEETADGYIARIWQHETDHLNGTMIIDRMGPVARLAARRVLKELQQTWDDEHPGEGKKRK